MSLSAATKDRKLFSGKRITKPISSDLRAIVRGGYKRFISAGVGEGHKEEYYEVQEQRFLGAEGFGDDLQRTLGKPPVPVPVSPKPLDTLVQKLAHELEMPVEVLRSPDRRWAVSKARMVTAYVLVRRVGCRWQALAPEGLTGKTFVEFFQTDKETGAPKGILALNLRRWRP